MKKFILPLLLFGVTTTASAQLDVLGQLSKTFKSNSSSSENKEVTQIGEGIKNVLGAVLGGSTLTENDLNGTWNYQGIDCVFKSEDILLKAGGAVGTEKIEGKINDVLKKVGIKSGDLSFTFDADKNFTINVKGKSVKGTYELDLNEKIITLKYKKNISFTAHIAKNLDTLSLLYDADKFFKFLTSISATSQNASIASISKLLKNYEGMLIGIEMKK
jgi:hypothetical protein